MEDIRHYIYNLIKK